MGMKYFALGMLCAFLLVGCAGFGWKYRYYGVNVESLPQPEKGLLQGPEPKDDLTLTSCLPTPNEKSPCVMQFKSEYFKIKRDKQEIERRLVACEQELRNRQ